MVKFRTFIALFVVSGLSLFTCACSSSKPEAEATEVPIAEGTLSETPEQELFDMARDFYARHMYTVARDSFTSLKNTYPFGPYAEYSALKLADCAYFIREYDAAATAYENFSKDHPGSSARPYALYQSARSFQLSHKGEGRDPTPLERAKAGYGKFLSEYPNSVYSDSARVNRAKTLNELAHYDELIIDYYERFDNQAAADARRKTMAQNEKSQGNEEFEQVTLASSKGRKELPESTFSVGDSAAQPQLVAAIRPGAPPSVATSKRETTLKKADVPVSESPVLASSTFKVQAVQCRKTDKQIVTLLLNRDITQHEQAKQFLSQHLLIKPAQSKAVISVPGLDADAGTKDCFGKGDLVISEKGSIELQTSSSVKLMSLSNPPRIILVVG